MQKLPILCPSCSNGLQVSELTCSNCETVVRGNYTLPAILKLSPSEQEFILEFVYSGGSLKTMASKLGKSYPTVRNMLDDLIAKMKEK